MMKASTIGAFALLACTLLALTDATSSANQLARRKYEQKLKDPTGTAKPDEYMKYYPDKTEYIQKRLGPTAAIGLAFAALSILALLCHCCCCCLTRCCCCTEPESCCKGCVCNCCCGTADPDAEGYTCCKRTIIFMLFSIATLGIGAMGVVGDKGVKEVCGGTNLLLGDALSSVAEMSSTITTMGNAIGALGQDKSQIDEMKKPIDEVVKNVGDIKDKVSEQCKADGNAELASKIYFAVFAANCLFGCCSWICSCSCPSSVLTFTGFFLMILAWILMSVYLSVGALLDDTCVQLQLWSTCKGALPAVKPKTCSDGSLKLDAFLKCPDPKEFKANYEKTYDQIETLQDQYKAKYGGNAVQFTKPSAAAPALTKALFSNYEANTAYRKTLYKTQMAQTAGCDPDKKPAPDSTCMTGAQTAQCPEGDPIVPSANPVVPPGVNSFSCAQKGVIVASDLMWGNSFIASCRYLNNLATKAVADKGSCNKLGDGFIYLTASHGLIGTCYIFIIMITCWSRKAWDSENYAELKQTDDADLYGAPNNPPFSADGTAVPMTGVGLPAQGAQEKSSYV